MISLELFERRGQDLDIGETLKTASEQCGLPSLHLFISQINFTGSSPWDGRRATRKQGNVTCRSRVDIPAAASTSTSQAQGPLAQGR